MTAVLESILTTEQKEFFQREGYLIVRELFERNAAQELAAHFMDMHARRAIPNYDFKDPKVTTDPLQLYSRIMQPHRFDKPSLQWLLDARVWDVLRGLLNEEPVATQSMLYFKPPGARGQAFHQDNYYLKVRPKSCIAAWTALDRVDPDNGGLQVCPRTHDCEVFCPGKADMTNSFTTEFVKPPTPPVAVVLEPGDVLFFNGSVVHGSTPNHSKDRWRRSFICHYAPESMHEISHWYFPLLNKDGGEIQREKAPDGGPCGNAPDVE